MGETYRRDAMSRKAILKLAGYVVECHKHKPGANWFWYKAEDYRIESKYYHISEEHSWRSAWKHFAKLEKQHD